MATSVSTSSPPITGMMMGDDSTEGLEPEPQSKPTEQVSVTLPESIQLKPGEKKDMVCTLEGAEDGMAMLTSIQGVPLGEKGSKKPEMKKMSGRDAGERFSSLFGPQRTQVPVS